MIKSIAKYLLGMCIAAALITNLSAMKPPSKDVLLTTTDDQKLTIPQAIADQSVFLKNYLSEKLQGEIKLTNDACTGANLEILFDLIKNQTNPTEILKKIPPANLIPLLVASNYLDTPVTKLLSNAIRDILVSNDLDKVTTILLQLELLPATFQQLLQQSLIDEDKFFLFNLFKGHLKPKIFKNDDRSEAITAIECNPTHNFILTGSVDGKVQLLDVNKNIITKTLEGHSDSITAAAFNPTTMQVLTGSEDRTARQWDLNLGEIITILHGHRSGITSLAISKDGAHALTGSYDMNALLWDLKKGVLLKTLEGHTDRIVTVAISPDGNYALTGSADNHAILWHLKTEEKVIKPYKIFKNSLTYDSLCCVAFGEDSDIYAATPNSFFVTWNTNNKNVATADFKIKKRANFVRFNPTAKYALIVGTSSKDVHLVKLSDPKKQALTEPLTLSIASSLDSMQPTAGVFNDNSVVIGWSDGTVISQPLIPQELTLEHIVLIAKLRQHGIKILDQAPFAKILSCLPLALLPSVKTKFGIK